MSGSKQKAIVVTRTYKPASDSCSQAITLLLKNPVSKAGTSAITAPDDGGKAKEDYPSRRGAG